MPYLVPIPDRISTSTKGKEKLFVCLDYHFSINVFCEIFQFLFIRFHLQYVLCSRESHTLSAEHNWFQRVCIPSVHDAATRNYGWYSTGPSLSMPYHKHGQCTLLFLTAYACSSEPSQRHLPGLARLLCAKNELRIHRYSVAPHSLVRLRFPKQPEAKEHGHGQLTKMMNEAILMMVAMVALSPAAHAASCISSSLIITELGDPSSVPDGIDAARARFVQLYVVLSFFSPNTIAMHCR